MSDLTPWNLSSAGGGVFLLDATDELVELTETAFATEDELQELIARHPRLIPSALSSDGDRRWLLVAREQGVSETVDGAARWWLDHLLLDQDGVPTLVEVKRSTDTRLRREVVGQLLDYAAGAVGTWRAADLRAVVEADPEALAGLLGPDADEEAFWEQVEANLRAGRLRLVFLADRIPPELERVVAFLDAQMNLCEVRAVEVRRLTSGKGTATITTRIVGATTAGGSAAKAGRSSGQQWDEPRLLQAITEQHGPEAAAAARRIIDWFRNRGARIWFGKGPTMGSVIPSFALPDGRRLFTIGIWTGGGIEVQFQHLIDPPFDDGLREELARRLEEIPGVQIPRDRLRKRPTFLLEHVTQEPETARLLGVLEWCLDTAITRTAAAPDTGATAT